MGFGLLQKEPANCAAASGDHARRVSRHNRRDCFGFSCVVPKGFFPEQDNGTIFGGMQGPQDSSFQAMQAAALRVSETIKNDPAVAAVVSFVGGSGPVPLRRTAGLFTWR